MTSSAEHSYPSPTNGSQIGASVTNHVAREHAADSVGFVRRFLLRQKTALKMTWAAHLRAKARDVILKTPPAPVDPHSALEIHSLTCERDYTDLLWCLKTLFLFSERSFHVVLHDDGSLRAQSLEHLRRHLPGAMIVSRGQADERVRDTLAGRHASRAFRERCPLARRLLDFPAFASGEHFLILDSDVLFFAKPEAMLHLMDSRRPFFMSDYQDGYVFSRAEVLDRYGVDIVPAFNTGISYLAKPMIDHDFIETCCRDLERLGLLAHSWSEQTLFAILFSRRTQGTDRLPAAYGIGRSRIGPGTVSHHFVNDGSREFLHIAAIPRLRRAGFVADYTKQFTRHERDVRTGCEIDPDFGRKSQRCG